jgi:hypothetical protein
MVQPPREESLPAAETRSCLKQNEKREPTLKK